MAFMDRDWSDLRKRLISSLVLVAVGALELWWGGWPFAVFVILVTGTMLWELWGLTLARGRDGLMFLGLGVALLIAGQGLLALRFSPSGLVAVLWLILVVVASDTCGYFVGRILGGPKFWPRLSPKKTWSGTIAGWLGAALVGAVFWAAGVAGAGLILVSPLVAFAGQMGDITESWAKRRAGVKDASNLIPGHGGVLDRFDALIGATLAMMVLRFAHLLPFAGL